MEQKKIGCIERGDIAVTGAYALNAKYIIHTVGPIWVDGKHEEFETFESCYAKFMQKKWQGSFVKEKLRRLPCTVVHMVIFPWIEMRQFKS